MASQILQHSGYRYWYEDDDDTNSSVDPNALVINMDTPVNTPASVNLDEGNEHVSPAEFPTAESAGDNSSKALDKVEEMTVSETSIRGENGICGNGLLKDANSVTAECIDTSENEDKDDNTSEPVNTLSHFAETFGGSLTNWQVPNTLCYNNTSLHNYWSNGASATSHCWTSELPLSPAYSESVSSRKQTHNFHSEAWNCSFKNEQSVKQSFEDSSLQRSLEEEGYTPLNCGLGDSASSAFQLPDFMQLRNDAYSKYYSPNRRLSIQRASVQDSGPWQPYNNNEMSNNTNSFGGHLPEFLDNLHPHPSRQQSLHTNSYHNPVHNSDSPRRERDLHTPPLPTTVAITPPSPRLPLDDPETQSFQSFPNEPFPPLFNSPKPNGSGSEPFSFSVLSGAEPFPSRFPSNPPFPTRFPSLPPLLPMLPAQNKQQNIHQFKPIQPLDANNYLPYSILYPFAGIAPINHHRVSPDFVPKRQARTVREMLHEERNRQNDLYDEVTPTSKNSEGSDDKNCSPACSPTCSSSCSPTTSVSSILTTSVSSMMSHEQSSSSHCTYPLLSGMLSGRIIATQQASLQSNCPLYTSPRVPLMTTESTQEINTISGSQYPFLRTLPPQHSPQFSNIPFPGSENSLLHPQPVSRLPQIGTYGQPQVKLLSPPSMNENSRLMQAYQAKTSHVPASVDISKHASMQSVDFDNQPSASLSSVMFQGRPPSPSFPQFPLMSALLAERQQPPSLRHYPYPMFSVPRSHVPMPFSNPSIQNFETVTESPDPSVNTTQATAESAQPDSHLDLDEKSGKKKNNRKPWHIDLQQLQIGRFKVCDKPEKRMTIPKVEVFTAKPLKMLHRLKVLFSKRVFVYEFDVPNIGDEPQKDTVACIHVPFASVVAMSCEDRNVQIEVKEKPSMYVGYRHARSNSVGMSIVYDRSGTKDLTGGELEKHTVHQLLLQKYQAEKLKEILELFDPTFTSLYTKRISPPDFYSLGSEEDDSNALTHIVIQQSSRSDLEPPWKRICIENVSSNSSD